MPYWLELVARWLALWNRRRLHRRQQQRRLAYDTWCTRHDTPDVATRQALQARAAEPSMPAVAIVVRAGAQPLAAHQALMQSLRGQDLAAADWHVRFAADIAADTRRWWLQQAGTQPQLRCDDDRSPTDASALLNAVDAPCCAIVEPGDLWRPHTLSLLAESAARWPSSSLVYGDEDRWQDGRRSAPQLKAVFDPFALLTHDNLGGPAIWRTAALRSRLAGVTLEPEAWHHDLALRATHALPAQQFVHVPHLLAHRTEPRRWSAVAAARAVQAQLARAGIQGRAEPDTAALVRVHFALPDPPPWVTVVVPTRNGLALLRRCIDSILSRSTYRHFDIIVIDNGSDDPACLRWLRQAASNPRMQVRRDDGPFNFAALNNRAVAAARGDFVALVNNDIEVITPSWIEEMLGLAALPGVGAVGARLWYGDDTLQHAGVVLGIGGGAGHVLKRLRRGDPGPSARALHLQGYLAVTAACLMVRRSLYLDSGGLDAATFAVAFNDVDFSCRLAAAGLHNLWTPHAELYHHESVSRGKDKNPAHAVRFAAELAALQARWSRWLRADPFYNPNLSLQNEDMVLAEPPRLQLLRRWFDTTTPAPP
jgi:GT2 family glycosyltransferase